MENLFLGQNPHKTKHKPRIVKPIYLKESVFAYDLWEFKKPPKHDSYEVSSLYYEGIRQYIESCNFFKKELSEKSHVYIKDVDGIIEEVTPERMNDEIRSYVDKLYGSINFEYNNQKFSIPSETLKNIYLKQYNNIFNQKWLTNIQKHKKPMLKDEENKSYFVFNDCYVEVTKNGVKKKNLTELKGKCVWKDQVINHNFEDSLSDEQGEFEKLIANVCNHEEDRIKALCSAMGYLLHNFFSPSNGKAVILYDEALATSNTPNGGTGKGVIANAIKLLRFVAKIDGKQYKSDDKYKWSNVNPSTQLVWIDETSKEFDFKDLFSCLTDGWSVERKYQNRFEISPDDSPKVLICSNTILPNKGGSNLRRQFVVELSDYYSKKIIKGTEEPIKDEHGILFSKDWSFDEWNKFYSFMLQCCQLYLKDGLCDYKKKNVEINLLMQCTCEEFMEYINSTPPPLNENLDIKTMFNTFKIGYLGDDTRIVQRTFTNYLKRYCEAYNLEFKQTSKYNGNPVYQIMEKFGE